MESTILDILFPHLSHWGYSIIILMTFLETSAFLGLLVPGESVVVVAGLLASRGIFELGDVIWTAALGAIMGDTVGYFIGQRFGEGFFLKYGHYFFFKEEYLTEAKRFFDKHGGKAVFFGRFMAWLRSFAPVIAGISRMCYLKFLLFNVAGGAAWATLFSFISILLIILIGISCIYLDEHGFTDVLGGYTSGFAWFVLSIVIVNTIKQMVGTKA